MKGKSTARTSPGYIAALEADARATTQSVGVLMQYLEENHPDEFNEVWGQDAVVFVVELLKRRDKRIAKAVTRIRDLETAAGKQEGAG